MLSSFSLFFCFVINMRAAATAICVCRSFFRYYYYFAYAYAYVCCNGVNARIIRSFRLKKKRIFLSSSFISGDRHLFMASIYFIMYACALNLIFYCEVDSLHIHRSKYQKHLLNYKSIPCLPT